MDELWIRLVEHLASRVEGPMRLRLLLQPAMAASFAVMAGLEDARTDKAPYFWGLLSDPAHRGDMLRDGWKSISKVFLAALLLDIVYQVAVSRFVYPGEAVIVAFGLAIVPYLLLRGLITRIARAVRS